MANWTEYSRTKRVLPTHCPWCGEEITGTNRLLSNDFGGDIGEMDFGCDKCIVRPLSELKAPPEFKDPNSDPAVYRAIEEYRTAIRKEEWLAKRISLLDIK